MTRAKKLLLFRRLGAVVVYLTAVTVGGYLFPDYINIHSTAVFLVLIAWMFYLFAINYYTGRKVERRMQETEGMYQRALRMYALALHSRVRTEPAGADGMLKVYCGCGQLIGIFPKSDPEAVLKLSANHIEIELVAMRLEDEKDAEVKHEDAV